MNAPAGKTNAIRILESLGVPHDFASYEVTEEHVDAASVARQLGVSPDVVFKTLVAHDEKHEVRVFCIPAATDLDLKKAARASGVKKIDLINLKDLFPLTGYVRGGCSPIGMRRRYPVFIDEIASVYERIYVNAGARGLQVLLSPADLARTCGAAFADISRAPG